MYSVQWVKQLRNKKFNNGPFTQLVAHKSRAIDKHDEYIQRSLIPTHHFQKSLPRLPIPKLEDTCRRYLNAQKPILTDQQFQQTESHVHKFLKNDGAELHTALVNKDKRNKRTSYISEPWFDMYLRDRKPLPINYNPILIYTQETDPQFNDPVIKTTNLIISSARFLNAMKTGNLEPEVFHMNPKKSDNFIFRLATTLTPAFFSWYTAYLFNAYPLDMSQYKNLFHTTRLPRKDKDVIYSNPDSKHIVVINKGHFYTFDIFDNQSHILAAKLIAINLKKIMNDFRPFNDLSPGVLTAANRNDWAEVRDHLCKNEENRRTLSLIDSALFVVVLDDVTIDGDNNKLIRNYLYGNPQNRWYDKSFSLIVTKDGHAGINFEHSWGDGVAVLRYFQDIKKDIAARPGIYPEDVSDINLCPNIQKLEFELDEKAVEAINRETTKFQNWVNDFDVDYMTHEGFGKDICKKHKISPDAVMQLAFQLALYKMEQRSVPTYESCSTAAFKHGRTETIRPCTEMTKRFCAAMATRTIKDSMTDFRKMLLDCSNAHSQLVKEAAMGQGFDRHLFALKKMGEELGKEKIDLFEDPAYAWINHNILSTSTLSSPVVQAGGFGPVVADGYGIGYTILDNKLGAVVTSYKNHRLAANYVASLKASILDIIRLVSVK